MKSFFVQQNRKRKTKNDGGAPRFSLFKLGTRKQKTKNGSFFVFLNSEFGTNYELTLGTRTVKFSQFRLLIWIQVPMAEQILRLSRSESTSNYSNTITSNYWR